MSVEENKSIARRFFEEVWNGRLDVADEIFDPDFVFHSAATGDDLSPESIKRRVTSYRNAFPDLRVAVEDEIGEGDKVAYRVVWHGTHQGALDGAPPTGKRMEWKGTLFFRIEGGKIVDRWGNTETARMRQDIGAPPSR